MDNSKTLYPNLVLVGTKSANGRYYPAEVLKSATESGLYDGVPVFLDHDEKIQALVGQVVKAYWDAEKKCVRGDIRIFPSSPFADVVRYVFSNLGDSFGFSHVVEADVEEGEDPEIVKKIHRVRSVDLVVDPATTKGLQGLQEKLMEAKQKRLQECHQGVHTSSPLEEVLRTILQSYWNGEVSFVQALALLSRVLGVEQAKTDAIAGGSDMPKRESKHDKEKGKKMREQEDMKKKNTPEGGDEKIDLEDEDIAIEQEEEDMEAEGEDTDEDEKIEEQDEEEVEQEEVEEQEEGEGEEASKEDTEGDEEEEMGEELEEAEEDEGEEEDEEEEVIEEDEQNKDQQKSGETQQKQPTACGESKSKKALGKLKKQLAETKKLLGKIVRKRYLPTLKEFEIIEKSKDPSGVYEILAEAKKRNSTGKPKTLAEGKAKHQESEWDRMIAEVRRRKGLIR